MGLVFLKKETNVEKEWGTFMSAFIKMRVSMDQTNPS